MSVTTKTGDNGESGLKNGQRLKKSEPVFDALGDLDELNSVLGWCKVGMKNEDEKKLTEAIQEKLYQIMAIIGGEKNGGVFENDVLFLEEKIKSYETKIGTLKKFVTPGKNEISARLHIARAVCRRAERSVVRLAKGDFSTILKYLNRLSDLLFVMALH